MEPTDKPDPDSLAYWQTKLTEAWSKPDFVLDDTRYVLTEMFSHFQKHVEMEAFWNTELQKEIGRGRLKENDFKALQRQIDSLKEQTVSMSAMVDRAKSREVVIDMLWSELKKGREESDD